MIYFIAKQFGKAGSIAYPFDKSDIEYSSYLEDKYLENDIENMVVWNLAVYGEYNPVTHVSDKNTFETKISQLIEERLG